MRACGESELDIWKAIHFDDARTAAEYDGFMTNYFREVYADRADLFFQKCLFVCDAEDAPIGTCFIWNAYNRIRTIHWFKVAKRYEGRGIGRALLTVVMRELTEEDYPVYLHTQPSSYRAIKLYADFGFRLLSDPVVGHRQNDLEASLPLLEKEMPREDFAKLKLTICTAPQHFLDAASSSAIDQF